MEVSKPHMRLSCCLAALLLAVPGSLCAQTDTLKVPDGLSVHVNFLSRGESRQGGLSVSGDATENQARFILGRTRLSVDYRKPWLDTRITVQHSGVWGQQSNAASIYEAWARLGSPRGWFLQMGKQELNYDDERILGRNDWAMAALPHDVLKLGYAGHGHQVHLVLGYNQRPGNIHGGTTFRSDDGAQPYKVLQTLWYHYDVPCLPLSASLLLMNIGMERSGEEDPVLHYQQLAGTYVTFTPPQWKGEGSFYYQTGKDEFGIPIQAFMGSVKATRTFPAGYSLFAGYDYLSGDDNPVVPEIGDIGMARHKKVRGFSTVYGSHHQFYGAMDFFYVSAYYAGYTPGLQNLYAGGTAAPFKGLSVGGSYHCLAVASKISGAGKLLGHEVEGTVSYAVTKEAAITLGYSYMQGTSTLERLQRVEGRNHLHWLWLMLTVKPK